MCASAAERDQACGRKPFFETHLPRDSTDDLCEMGQRTLVHPLWRGGILEPHQIDESAKDLR